MDAQVISMENTKDAPKEMTDAMVTAAEAFADALDFCGLPEEAKVSMHYKDHRHNIEFTYSKNAEGDGYDAKVELVKAEDNGREFNTDPF